MSKKPTQPHPRKVEQPVVQPVKREQREENTEVEKLDSVEWGERLDSGKAIARGGKETGFVPGASPAK